MATTNEIRRFFEEKCQKWADNYGVTVFFENIITGKTKPEMLYLTTHLITAANNNGVFCHHQANGIFQINAFFPLGSGTDIADNLIDDLVKEYEPKKYNDIAIPIYGSRSGGYIVENRYCVVISIDYIAY